MGDAQFHFGILAPSGAIIKQINPFSEGLKCLS